MKINSRAAWGAGSNGRANRGALAMSAQTGLTVHWPGGGTNLTRLRGSQVASLLRTWQAQHRSQGWGDIGYNYLIDGGGTVWEGCGLYRGAHAGNMTGNLTTVGVQLITGTNEGPTAAQLDALAELRRWLLKRARRATRRYPHSYWTSTACPGNRIRAALPGIPNRKPGSTSQEGIFGMSSLKILTRTKDIKVGKMKRVLVPLENKYAATKPSSALIPAKGDIDFDATFDVAVADIPEGSRVLLRVVHQQTNGKIVGVCGPVDVVGTGGKLAYGQIVAKGSVKNRRRLRLEVYSPFADTTVASIKTRVRYGR